MVVLRGIMVGKAGASDLPVRLGFITGRDLVSTKEDEARISSSHECTKMAGCFANAYIGGLSLSPPKNLTGEYALQKFFSIEVSHQIALFIVLHQASDFLLFRSSPSRPSIIMNRGAVRILYCHNECFDKRD